MFTKKALAASVSAPPPAVYIEDVFSTYLYTGNGSTQTITNGIDLAGEGGLVWIKGRNQAYSHYLFDTQRGSSKRLSSDLADAEQTSTNHLTSFNSDGFSLGSNFTVNGNGNTWASWTFRKAAKFFDVVTYTGTGSARTIAHNLGSVPGCIIVKRTDTTGDWQVYHRSNGGSPATRYLVLNSTAATVTSSTRWNDTLPTSTVFSLGTDATVNASGGTYVAYLFAHDAGGFGDAGDQSVVKCGSYTGNGSATGPVVDLGWEPQWLLIKRGAIGDWNLIDNMRGFAANGTDAELNPHSSDAESTGTFVTPTSTGFQLNTTDTNYNPSNSVVYYIAIRRGPMKTPTSGTEVFNAAIGNNTGSEPAFTSGFPVDFAIWGKSTTGATFNRAYSRLTGGYMVTATTATEVARLGAFQFQDGWYDSSSDFTLGNSWMFRRAPGFFDVVAYTGTGANRTVSHNLGVVPELMIVKCRSNTDREWLVYNAALGNVQHIRLNGADAAVTGSTAWNSTSPTASVFSLGNNANSNVNAGTFIAYLFASAPGVSKVGSYTGTGTTLDIDCGFTAGARFVLVKRTDSTGDWYVWDTARGIVSGNDPYLLLNSTAAEVTNTDYIDPLSSGFQISSTAPAAINASGGSFIFLAIA